MENRVLTCVYCGHEYPQETPAWGNEVLTAHIRVCPKHPMRKAEADIVTSTDLLAWAIEWAEGSPHRPWCNVAEGNIYYDSGECSCGRDDGLQVIKDHLANSVICVNPARGKGECDV